MALNASKATGLVWNGLDNVYRDAFKIATSNRALHYLLLLGLIPASLLFLRRKSRSRSTSSAPSLDPGLLRKYTTFKSVTLPSSKITYPSIRLFYRPHPQAAQLPTDPEPLPLLVFVHGLGGCAAQFHPLLVTLVNNGPCLAIDLPGCGLSAFTPTTWDAYRIENLAKLVVQMIRQHLSPKQKVVLVGHSLGCSVSALVASNQSPVEDNLSSEVIALVAICPRATPPTSQQARALRVLTYLPIFIFDFMRSLDRRGGTSSASVIRFTGEDADEQTRALQLRFNESVNSRVWMRTAFGLLPEKNPQRGLPGREVWSGLEAPALLIAGEYDNVNKATEIDRIVEYLGKSKIGIESPVTNGSSSTSIDQTPAIYEHMGPNSRPNSRHGSSIGVLQPSIGDLSTLDSGFAPSKLTKPKLLKTVTLPAGHALLYMPSSSKILGSVISSFLEDHVSARLSLAWQLVYLSTEGKWDVKNLEKWQLVLPVSGPIAGVFRAMKTLREIDDRHRPELFTRDWGHTVKDVIDISHESPVYDPKGLEQRGVRYHKFPTVSKIPPTDDEVEAFVRLVDEIREERGREAADKSSEKPVIGVHCHYGYNRTGYFLVCYMVDRCGYKLQQAIDEFEKQKPPGIRHPHFINALHVRYCVGLQRRPTLL